MNLRVGRIEIRKGVNVSLSFFPSFRLAFLYPFQFILLLPSLSSSPLRTRIQTVNSPPSLLLSPSQLSPFFVSSPPILTRHLFLGTRLYLSLGNFILSLCHYQGKRCNTSPSPNSPRHLPRQQQTANNKHFWKVGMSSYLPWYLSYSIAAGLVAVLSGGALLYHYQCEIIYPANFPEGSRTHVCTDNCGTVFSLDVSANWFIFFPTFFIHSVC